MTPESNNYYETTKLCKHCGNELPSEGKFCPKCGTEMPIITQCQPQTNNQKNPNQYQILEKKIKNLYIIIPISMFATAIIISVITYFIFPSIFGLKSNANNNSNGNFLGGSANAVCPEDEYGNHEWISATCVNPSYCWNCGEYKDDKLGYHHFHYDEDIGETECYNCHMLKSEYDNQE